MSCTEDQSIVLNWVDSQAKHLAHPTTWDTPSQEELDAIEPGTFVKVAVTFIHSNTDSPSGERFWVKVTNVENDNIQGYVDNILMYPDDVGCDYGDWVQFEPRHVLDILPEKGAE